MTEIFTVLTIRSNSLTICGQDLTEYKKYKSTGNIVYISCTVYILIPRTITTCHLISWFSLLIVHSVSELADNRIKARCTFTRFLNGVKGSELGFLQYKSSTASVTSKKIENSTKMERTGVVFNTMFH